MLFSRRRFVWAGLVVGLSTLAGRLRGQTNVVSAQVLESGLQAWVEALLPSDEMSPGAGRLDVHLEVLAKAAELRPYRQLLELGLRWADGEARQSGALNFAALDARSATAIVARAEAMGLNAMPGLFFYHTLRDAKAFYYLHEESWAGVGFPRAPQPFGYMDYAEAPK